MFLVVEVLNECSCLGGVSTIWVVGTVARKVAMFTTFETKTLSASSVNVHGVGVTLSRCSWDRGLVMILRTRGISLEETSTGGKRSTRVRMVGNGEVDARC